jgi:hypothetical protein
MASGTGRLLLPAGLGKVSPYFTTVWTSEMRLQKPSFRVYISTRRKYTDPPLQVLQSDTNPAAQVSKRGRALRAPKCSHNHLYMSLSAVSSVTFYSLTHGCIVFVQHGIERGT